MFETLMQMNTNKDIISFVLNNMVLLLIIQQILSYVCKKTPWAIDDDLPSFFTGLIEMISKKKI